MWIEETSALAEQMTKKVEYIELMSKATDVSSPSSCRASHDCVTGAIREPLGRNPAAATNGAGCVPENESDTGESQ